MVIFFEYLDSAAGFTRILSGLEGARAGHPKYYVFDTGRPFPGPQRLEFDISQLRDPRGISLRLSVLYHGLLSTRDAMAASEGFRNARETLAKSDSRLGSLLEKSLSVPYTFTGGEKHFQAYHALLLMEVCAWKMRRDYPGEEALLVLNERHFATALAGYARARGIRTQFLPLVTRKSEGWEGAVRALKVTPARYLPLYMRNLAFAGLFPVKTPASPEPRIMVSSYGQFNLGLPQCFSDLFFYQAGRGALAGKDILLSFQLPQDPLTAEKAAALRERGIESVCLSEFATLLPPSRASIVKLETAAVTPPEIKGNGTDEKFINRQSALYTRTKNSWEGFFRRTGVKVHLGWYNCDLEHMAIADAVKACGGVAAIYHRSYELLPCAETAVDTDIIFGFSAMGAEIERQSGSKFRQYVVTGYLGDHRFGLLGPEARMIRARLLKNGCRKIIAFLDENTIDDGRWFTGHGFTRANYAFLLETMLREEWLGLVIKPKTPATLRRRLGPAVTRLLDRCVATGRCHLFSAGTIQSAYPPAAAALCGDIAIHEVLSAGTAGIECALAGVPTLLLDREGWPESPLCALAEGKVVFRDWDSLWRGLREHWEKGIEGFGDWQPMLGRLDPFRDGRAAERMALYLASLIGAFRKGADREPAMEEARENYRKLAGDNHVITL